MKVWDELAQSCKQWILGLHADEFGRCAVWKSGTSWHRVASHDGGNGAYTGYGAVVRNLDTMSYQWCEIFLFCLFVLAGNNGANAAQISACLYAKPAVSAVPFLYLTQV
jgi:hypothetical protein